VRWGYEKPPTQKQEAFNTKIVDKSVGNWFKIVDKWEIVWIKDPLNFEFRRV